MVVTQHSHLTLAVISLIFFACDKQSDWPIFDHYLLKSLNFHRILFVDSQLTINQFNFVWAVPFDLSAFALDHSVLMTSFMLV